MPAPFPPDYVYTWYDLRVTSGPYKGCYANAVPLRLEEARVRVERERLAHGWDVEPVPTQNERWERQYAKKE